MKNRWIAALLMLASVFGLFGCTAVNGSPTETDGDLPDGFIPAVEDGLLAGEAQLPENIVNVAETDEKGEALFQIVYNIDSSPRVQEQCEALAADIYDATGVKVPVVHSMEKQKDYEITVGDIARKETIDVIDGFFADYLAENVTKEDLAVRLHLSSRQLNRFLQKRYGMSFRGKLCSSRMLHAGWLLRHTQQPIQQIAPQVGYTSVPAFIRSFTRFHGKTPQQFRDLRD